MTVATIDPVEATPRNVVPWNNAPGRTAEEVAQLFDEIATELMTHGEG